MRIAPFCGRAPRNRTARAVEALAASQRAADRRDLDAQIAASNASANAALAALGLPPGREGVKELKRRVAHARVAADARRRAAR